MAIGRVLQQEIQDAVEALRAGELVAFPTETVYGLGANANNPDAVRKIFRVKGRPSTHPVIVHIDHPRYLQRWVREMTPEAKKLADAFWPGPLTLVAKRAPAVNDVITGGQDTVAIRVPNHPVAQQLLNAFGGGIAAPSANKYGHVSPTRAEHVREEFGDDLKFVLDGGDCKVGLESTIISCLADGPRVLRPGSISFSQLKAVVPTIQMGAEPERAARAGNDQPPLFPGDAGERGAESATGNSDERVHRQPREGGRARAAPAGHGESIHDLDQRGHPPGRLRQESLRQPAHARQSERARSSWSRKSPKARSGTRCVTACGAPPAPRTSSPTIRTSPPGSPTTAKRAGRRAEASCRRLG